MKREAATKIHLTPRQIINRYAKGKYVDEDMESISSSVSSCGKNFNSITIPLPFTFVDKILENLDVLLKLYGMLKAGQDIGKDFLENPQKFCNQIKYADTPFLKECILELANPSVLGRAIDKDKESKYYLNYLVENNLLFKYEAALNVSRGQSHNVISYSCQKYKAEIEACGLSPLEFEMIMNSLI